jgi:hypothetical protein
MSSVRAPVTILDPGLCLTLRPMCYPVFYDMFRDGIENTSTVEDVDFRTDLGDLKLRLGRGAFDPLHRLKQPSPQFIQTHQLAGGTALSLQAALRRSGSRSVLSHAAR